MGILTGFCALLLIINGVYLSVGSGLFQLRRLGFVLKVTVGGLVKSRNTDGFKAMAVALGGTIGVGNIIGVAAAIKVGGAGAVFWMLITGFMGMIIKFAEIYICVDEAKLSRRDCGGPMYVLKNRCGRLGRPVASLFAAACVAASLSSGNFLQSKAFYHFADIGFGLSFGAVTAVLLPLVFVIISGHDRLFQNFSAVLVPLMSSVYTVAVIVMIIKNRERVPSALLSVFSEGMGLRQAVGGAVGTGLSLSLKTGVMKGLFTNEAGMGSSPIAHSGARNADPFTQGCWGVVEVFVDTVVVCMLTAVAVLSSAEYCNVVTDDPFLLICEMFKSSFGGFGIKLLSFSVCCFALAAAVGWSYYGLKALSFLSGSPLLSKAYRLCFVLMIPFSAVLSDGAAWLATDLFNFAMLIPNSCMLLAMGNAAVKPLKRARMLDFGHSEAYNKKKPLGRCKYDMQSMPERVQRRA